MSTQLDLYNDILETIQQIGIDIKYVNDRIDWILDASGAIEMISVNKGVANELSTVITEVDTLIHGPDTDANSLAKVRKDMSGIRRKLNSKIILLEERLNLYILGESLIYTNLGD